MYNTFSKLFLGLQTPPPAQAHVTSAFLIKRLFLRLEIASSTERRWGTPEKKGVEIFQLNVYF